MRRVLRLLGIPLSLAGIVTALFLWAKPTAVPEDERRALAAPLAFDATYLDTVPATAPRRSIREVHPDVRHIDAWISSVGASAALADVDGTGRPADICLVDPRVDRVSLRPAPGTGERFRPFALPHVETGYAPGTIAPMGCLLADFNEDGRVDVLVYYWGRTPVVFLQRPAPTLSAAAFAPVEIVAEREIWNTNAAMLADVDGDGHPDLLFGNYFQDGERVLDPTAPRGTFEMQHSMSRAANGGRNRLLLWADSTAATVRYRDVSELALTPEMSDGWTLALGARDLDRELTATDPSLAAFHGLPELYVANDFGPDRLLLNRSRPGRPVFTLVEGRRGLTTPRSKVLGRDSFKGMGVDFGDVTGGEGPAIAVSNIASPFALIEGQFLFEPTGDASAWHRGVAPYRDRGFARGVAVSGWAWDIKFVDIVNAGRPAIAQAIGFVHGESDRWPELQELATGNDELLRHPRFWPRFSAGDDLSGDDHDRLFVPDGDGRYHDLWPLVGPDTATVTRGIAVGDVYGDGRLSLVLARQWEPSLFLRNRSDAGRAIVVDLRVPGHVPGGTRAAIGAEARVRLADGRTVTAVVDGGSGHSGQRAPEIHLGVGAASPQTSFDVEVSWRHAGGVAVRNFRLTPGRHRILLAPARVASHQPAPSGR